MDVRCKMNGQLDLHKKKNSVIFPITLFATDSTVAY